MHVTSLFEQFTVNHLQVEDQMKLLHNSWSEILILDFIYRQIHNVWGKEILMVQSFCFDIEMLVFLDENIIFSIQMPRFWTLILVIATK